MSWKCDICDSYNKESSRQCYVCGQVRSIESIKEGRIDRVNAAILNVVVVLRLLFVLGVSVSLVTVVVALIGTITGGRLDDIWQITKTAAEHIHQNVGSAFDKNLKHIILYSSSVPVAHLSTGAKEIWSVAAYNGSHFIRTAFSVLPDAARVNFQNCYYHGIAPIANGASIHIDALDMALSRLIANIHASFGNFSKVITSLYNVIIKHFD